MSGPRLRFAPSPTGFLHVGGARTALFNWLYVRKHGGTLVLRLEDTDTARERPEFRAAILEGLSWLGLDWDEGPEKGGPYGPYAQSERLHLYRAAAEQLERDGFAYPCFCEPVARDDDAEPAACRCVELSAQDVAAKVAAEPNPALRVRVDAARVYRVHDMIRGDVEFPAGEIEDFIITRRGGQPLYNFVVVVDDAAMRITHVVRGEEHLANTPKQLVLYEALGHPAPQFAHLPIILNAERKKLSKRDGATAVFDYQKLGFLPQALVNFLALLGWSPGEDRELLAREEMIALFDFARVQKHGAVFDTVKLAWMNGEYVKTVPLDELVAAVQALLACDPHAESLRTERAHVAAICTLLRERVKTLADITSSTRYLFTRDLELDWEPEAVAKRAGTAEARARLATVHAALAEAISTDEQWERGRLEEIVRALAVRESAKAGDFIQPMRVAVTGVAVSAGIFEVCEVLGRAITLGRIDAFLRRFA